MALQKRWQRPVSRREALVAGALGGAATAFGLPLVTADRASAAGDKAGDIKILNTALFYEHQAIWAYGAAAGRLSSGDVGRAVLMIAQANRADHEQHRDTLAAAVRQLGGSPVGPQPSYDLSDYIRKGEGNLDSDVNIAKLALALEVDAAIAYTQEVAQLSVPALITAGASIGSTESAHATAIRAAFNALGVKVPMVPAAFVSQANRDRWILKV